MADVYSDSHISFDMLALLEAAGHSVMKSQTVGLRDASDLEHLWHAARHGRTVISSDTGFADWHHAWRFLARAWQVDVHHAGILIIPNTARLGVESAARAIDQIMRAIPDLTDSCHILRVDGTWQRQPDG